MVDELSGRLGEGSKVGLESSKDMEGHRLEAVEGSMGWRRTRQLRIILNGLVVGWMGW